MGKYKFPRGTPFNERIKVVESGCWEWQGSRSPLGYGRYYPAMGVKVLAHRHAYELANGPIPDGMQVCHTCDNPPCCNPGHLFLGTHQDNMADRQSKGRTRTGTTRGEKSNLARLTQAQVVEIRGRYRNGETQTAIARDYGITNSGVWRIVHGKTWREPTVYRKEIVYCPETHDYALYLDDELVGFSKTYQEGDTTLDALIDELSKSSQQPAA